LRQAAVSTNRTSHRLTAPRQFIGKIIRDALFSEVLNRSRASRPYGDGFRQPSQILKRRHCSSFHMLGA
jgi:hypothetical protein